MALTESFFFFNAVIPLQIAIAPAIVVAYGILNFIAARLIMYPSRLVLIIVQQKLHASNSIIAQQINTNIVIEKI